MLISFTLRCDYIERRDLWSSLLHVKPVLGPWLVGGDFNVVRDASDLIGMSRLFVKLKRLKNHLKWRNRDVFGSIFDKITEAESAVRSAELACEADPSDSNWTALSDRNADLARVTAMEHLLTGDPFVLDCPDFSGFPSVISDEENYGITATPSLEELVNAVKSSLILPPRCSERLRSRLLRITGFAEGHLPIKHGSSLWAKFLMRKYCLLAHPACVSSRGFISPTWRRLLQIRPRAESGICWRVGHGDLSFWDDCWFRDVPLSSQTELLYSRLRVVAERLISPNQSGFVPGRMISDNILLAQELTHSLTLPTRGGNVILKLDMAKAYDRVQWPFLFEVLRHFGFSERVVEMVSACISHCHFSVNINGSLSGFFGSTRGLRQGDPLSPMLFILGAEYLSRGLDRLYLQHPELRYRSGCDILISHLAYADDVIIFANGGSRSLRRLMGLLHHYENCSGQLVNAVKSSVILPPRCSERLRSRILRITRFAEGHLPLKYLGVPLFRGNRVCSLFEHLLQSVRRKLEGWEIRTLSPGSRITLIRSVLLSMPIYLFQVVQPPLAVMENLELVFNAFLWGSRTLEKKWHWAKWSRACLPVMEGGLGFRRLKDLVDSFSIKLWFRFRHGSSLWARFLLRKYCQMDAPASVLPRGLISPTWRRLLWIRPRAEPGIRWRVGLGDVSFWDDIWFGDTAMSSQCEVRGGRAVRVFHFLSEGAWDFDLLCAVVAPSVAEAITLTPIAFGEPDLALWIHSSDGAFSIRSAWELVRLRDPVSDILTPCWGRWLRPTMSFFLWRFWHQWLPLDDMLQRRGFELASRCQCCDMSETFTHVFIDGPIARYVWHFFGAIFRVRIPCTGDLRLFLSAWKRNLHWAPGGHVKEFLPFIVLWFLWMARNDAKHRQLRISGETVKSQILSYLRLAHAVFIVKPKHWLGAFEAARSLGIFVAFQRTHRLAIVRWLCPPPGCFKLNVDGSSRGNPGESSVGGVVRDSSGRVVLSFSEFIGVGTNVRAELWAVWRGLLICSDLGLFPLWVETDSQISLQILRSRRCHWDLHRTVTRILFLLRGRAVHFSHIFREGNSVADALAARAHTIRASPWPPLSIFCVLLPGFMVALDDLSQWFLWPRAPFMSGFICSLLLLRALVALHVISWLPLISTFQSRLDL
ncbi:uncharacterized protein LOC142521250 [Primulina tabacum]|uniref:uncharacterized protein LOC142521250 n=1 Tax=Primulina tabacum TaxID=48773 RepID=UPI003F596AC8